MAASAVAAEAAAAAVAEASTPFDRFLHTCMQTYASSKLVSQAPAVLQALIMYAGGQVEVSETEGEAAAGPRGAAAGGAGAEAASQRAAAAA